MLFEPIPKMNIRKAATDDLERIVELLAQLGYANDVEQVERYLHELRQSSSGEVFVAQDGGNVVGVAVVHAIKPLHVQGTWGLLSALVVDDERRSSGVGASLLIAAEALRCSMVVHSLNCPAAVLVPERICFMSVTATKKNACVSLKSWYSLQWPLWGQAV